MDEGSLTEDALAAPGCWVSLGTQGGALDSSRTWSLRLRLNGRRFFCLLLAWSPGCSGSNSLDPVAGWLLQEQALPPPCCLGLLALLSYYQRAYGHEATSR